MPGMVRVKTISGSPWMTAKKGAEYVRCPTSAAVQQWAMRAGLIYVLRGTRRLYARADVLDALRCPFLEPHPGYSVDERAVAPENRLSTRPAPGCGSLGACGLGGTGAANPEEGVMSCRVG